MLPNFFVLGTQKGGTTTLHNWLQGHPDIYLPGQKETKFFARDREWMKGVDFYTREYFSDWNAEKAVGEIDPDYMFHEPVLERLQSVYGDISSLKLIFVLRNPTERAFSHYLMTHRRGFDLLSFEDAIEQEPERIKGDFDDKMHFSYVGRGYYYHQIKRYLDYVGRNNILVLFSEDLTASPAAVLSEVCQFLEVDPNYTPQNLQQRFHEASKPRFASMRAFLDHAGFIKKTFRALFPFVKLRQAFKKKLLLWNEKGNFDQKPVIKDSTRNQLIARFSEDISKLEQFTGRDLSHWK